MLTVVNWNKSKQPGALMTTYTPSKHPTPTPKLLANCRMELILKEWSAMWEAWLEALVPPCLHKQYKFLFGKGALVKVRVQTSSLANPEEVRSLTSGHRKPPVSQEGCWPDAIGVLPEQEHNSTQIKSNSSQCCYGWSFPVFGKRLYRRQEKMLSVA